MPLFGRRKKQPPTPVAPPDPDLAPLDVEQAALLRRLVRDDLAGRGIEGEPTATQVRTADLTYGLTNLARRVAGHEQRDWPRVVAEHVTTISTADDPDTLGEADLERRVHARLLEDGPELARMFPDGLRPAPGLRLVLCIDYPTRVQFVDQEFYAARGGLDRWWTVGFANLRDLVEELDLEHIAIGQESEVPRFDIVEADSVYVASLAAVLPELLASRGQVSLGRGVLVAVPDRSHVLFRVVDGAQALPAIGEIARLSTAAHASSVGPLSPHVYLVRDGWHQLTEIEGDTIKVVLGPEAADAFDLDDRG